MEKPKNYGKINFPRQFKERYNKILGRDEAKKFFKVMETPLKKTIRINTIKVDEKLRKKIIEKYNLEQLPFYKDGYRINVDKPGNLFEYFMGYIYSQEAASMIPPLCMELKENLKVLDLCAAPGSKTSQIAQIMNNKGLIIANEAIIYRLKLLRNNLERMGCLNTIVINKDGRNLKFKEKFDRVLVDAPCSSEGTIRKDFSVLSRWNIKFLNDIASLQKQLLKTGILACKEGGIIVYSTCTLSPEENEGVVDWALKNFNVELEEIKLNGIKARPGLVKVLDFEFDPEVKKCIRIWPHIEDMEGFFVAKFRKLS